MTKQLSAVISTTINSTLWHSGVSAQTKASCLISLVAIEVCIGLSAVAFRFAHMAMGPLCRFVCVQRRYSACRQQRKQQKINRGEREQDVEVIFLFHETKTGGPCLPSGLHKISGYRNRWSNLESKGVR